MIIVFGIVIASAAAARSTWSPCGLSMLSQITPMAEAGRQQKFARTAGWFIVGAVLGGVMLGGAIALGALAIAAAGVRPSTAIALVVVFSFFAAAIDAHLFGFAPPFVRRQVNEDWLSTYRAWVYGAGFGWQIGTGVTTYVMTAAVPLMIVVGALSRSPWAAIAIGAGFGLARGLAVLMGARLHSPAALLAFHRRFGAWGEPIRQAAIGAQLAVAVMAVWIVAPIVIAGAVSVAAVALFTWCARRAPSGLPLDAAKVPARVERQQHPLTAGVDLELVVRLEEVGDRLERAGPVRRVDRVTVDDAVLDDEVRAG